MLIKGFRFDGQFNAFLETDGDDIPLAKGTEVNLPLSSEVHCLGYTREGKEYTCPKAATGKKQCNNCAKEDDFLACLRCDGAVCLQFTGAIKEGCTGGDYSVYLASFGEHVKAGISRTDRLQRRWVEQGADYAAKVFGNLNGRDARVVESTLFRAGFLPRHTTAEKLALPLPDKSAFEDELESAHFRKIAEQFRKNAAPAEIADLQPFYPAITEAKPSGILQGKVLGNKGPILFLEQNGQNRLFALPNAVGRKVITNTLAAFT